MQSNADSNFSLIFVYNADSGLFNTLTDIAHKIFSPSTYQCQLCQITHASLAMRKSWRQYLNTVLHKIDYLHRDDYQTLLKTSSVDYPVITYPAILLKRDNADIELLVNSDEISVCNSVQSLVDLINKKLAIVE